VNVATTAALVSAIQNALPGDRIVMASGSYNAGLLTSITRSGTTQNPTVLTGPRTAVISGGAGDGLLVTASDWIFSGFRVTGTTNAGIVGRGANRNIYDNLEIDHTGTIGIAISVGSSTGTVTGNEVRYNLIHDTGLARADFGEGVYLGNGTTGLDKALNTHIHHNTIGPNIGAETIEAKVSADGNLIEFNTISGNRPALVIRSNNNVVNDNTISGLSTGYWLIGIGSDVAGRPATNNVFHRNTGSHEKSLFYVDANSSGTQIFCDNTVVAPTLPGATCTP
jgi:hypothetical protein